MHRGFQCDHSGFQSKGRRDQSLLPKVILGIASNNSVLGEIFEPKVSGLQISLQAQRLVALEVRRIQTGGVQPIHIGQQLPRVVDGLLLEVVSEGPAAQHLEEGVVVGIPSHVVKIIVLATGTDALLRVGRPLKLGQRTRGIGLAQEDGLELIHAGVGKEEGGVGQGNGRTGRDHGVRSGFGGEVIHKGRSDLVGGPLHVSVGIGRSAGDG